MDVCVRKPKKFVHAQGLPFSLMSPLEVWVDERNSMRYVEIKCPNVAEEWSWAAMSNADDVRRLAHWLISAADWMASKGIEPQGRDHHAGLR